MLKKIIKDSFGIIHKNIHYELFKKKFEASNCFLINYLSKYSLGFFLRIPLKHFFKDYSRISFKGKTKTVQEFLQQFSPRFPPKILSSSPRIFFVLFLCILQGFFKNSKILRFFYRFRLRFFWILLTILQVYHTEFLQLFLQRILQGFFSKFYQGFHQEFL